MSFAREGWTNDPLEKGDAMSGDYIAQIQNDTSYRREVAELGIPSWRSPYGDKFYRQHVEEIKGSLEEPDLLRFYGYTKIEDVLGRRWSDLPRNVEKEQDLAGFSILNDMREVVDNLSRPLYITDDGGGWAVRTRIKDSGDAVGWKRFDGDPDFYNSFDYITHDVASGDFLYMTSIVDKEVHRFRMNGSGRASLHEPPDDLAFPHGITYDASGDFLFVANSDLSDVNYITKVKMDGSLRSTYNPSFPNDLNDPEGLDYDPATGFLYIMDRGYHRIVKVRFDGSGRQTFGSQGSSANQFEFPYGIHYDPALGFIYVADTGNDRIVKTKIDGSGWTVLGSTGTGDSQFDGPLGIYYDSKTELIYVADDANNRVVRTKIDGSEWRAYYGRVSEEFGSVHDVTM